jgi:ankyrin repeat protein
MHCPYHGCLTHIAIKTNQPKLLRWLIENGADIWSTNNFRENALDYAAENNQSEMLEMLIKRALRENSEKNTQLFTAIGRKSRCPRPDVLDTRIRWRS